MQQLRTHALTHSLAGPTTLRAAIERLGFVQADPIRSPATAQDLILRQRVPDYRVGDLERHYPSLDIEEGILYAYGFLPRDLWQLRQQVCDPTSRPELEQRVLAVVRSCGPLHPKDLEAEFGSERVTNDWGGYSKATTQALERLRSRGLLRIARREKGIRVYEAAPPPIEMPPNDRLRKLILVHANILAPVREKTLQGLVSGLLRSHRFGDHRLMIRELLQTGELEKRNVDGISYVWPTSDRVPEEQPRRVRFLAPFDPLVWDRHRFQHLWQWDYRFEAYTPQAKRVRGYYAMPLLWGKEVIGWANAGVTKGKLNVELGFVEKQPSDPAFRIEADAEIARLETSLGLDTASQ